MIYTSYFSCPLLKNNNDVMMISIARVTPKWFWGPSLVEVVPPYSLLKMYKDNINEVGIQDYYRSVYISEVLNKLDVYRLKQYFDSFKKDIVLCRYEKTGDFCHRLLFGKWLSDNGFEYGGEYSLSLTRCSI